MLRAIWPSPMEKKRLKLKVFLVLPCTSFDSFSVKISTLCFQFLDQHDFYMTLDIDMLIDIMTTELQYLSSNWSMPGRPILVLPLHSGMLSE